MEFPTMLYRGQGPHQRTGGTYAYIGVNDQSAYDEKIKQGWYPTLDAAIAAFDGAEEEPEAAPIDESSPPTRAELEIKARELGIKFDGRTGDKRLALLIEQALG
jgi:hypothetical protein